MNKPHPEIARQLGIPANEKCVCESPRETFACPWGHPDGCHYPKECAEALCEHFVRSADWAWYERNRPRCDECGEDVDACNCKWEDEE